MAFESYGRRQGVTLPKETTDKQESRNNHTSNVTKEIKKRVEAESDLAKAEQKLGKKKSRAGYMRDYRRRPKLCPHCKKQI